MRTILIAAVVLFPGAARASVSIETEPIQPTSLFIASAAEDLARDVAEGGYDDLEVRVPVTGATARLPAEVLSTEGGRVLLEVSSRSFAVLPERVRSAVAERIVKASYDPGFMPIYRATVDVRSNADELARTDLLRMLGTMAPDLPDALDAAVFLGTFARSWAYREPGKSGPNCWHAAIAATAPRWWRPRYMPPEEFRCQLDHYYERVDADGGDLSKLAFGDVVRLVDRAGNDIHGCVYLGPDRAEPGRHIVFTKNGFRRGYYLFQDYDTVTGSIYPGTTASFYRAVRPAPDPDSGEASPCRSEPSRPPPAPHHPDPIVTTGLRATAGEPPAPFAASLKPVEID